MFARSMVIIDGVYDDVRPEARAILANASGRHKSSPRQVRGGIDGDLFSERATEHIHRAMNQPVRVDRLRLQRLLP